MKALVLLLFLTGLPVSGQAERAPSIMFDDPEPAYVQKPKSDTDQLQEECKQLSQEMERLKGRPLRRAAAAERYKADCERLYTQELSVQQLD